MELLTDAAGRGRALLLAGLALSIPVQSLGAQLDEYDVKAAFLLSFAKFVEWPPEVPSDSLVICIVGDDPFGTAMDRLTQDKGASRRALEVRRLKEPSDAVSCHIAYVRSAEREKAVKLVTHLRAAPVLTIGDSFDFPEKGGVIGLPVENGKVNVVINTTAADEAHLKISAKLLSVARLLPKERPRE